MANDNTQRDIVLDAGTYAFVRDRTQSAMKICTGPTTVTPSQSDEPVKFDPKTGRFVPCGIDAVIQSNVQAEFGQYVVLKNPAVDGKPPKPEMKGTATYSLDVGSKVIIPGPADFPLWPRQSAEVIDGHNLKSNQFLLVRIYHEELAKKNWGTAIMRPATITPPAADATEEEKKAFEAKVAQAAQTTTSVDLTTGKLHIIKGTDVSFFIPPSGVEVVRDEQGKYVRDALTLERMEYAILVDENGRKRYERGPQVVFPSPTETFQVKDGAKKQNAIETNKIQGIHVKASVDCTVYNTKFVAGEEYFITGSGIYNSEGEKIGAGVTIYFPCEELAFVKYDGKTKIFAVAVPQGEGRYVMDRTTSEIVTVKGPTQLLPNPVTRVIVRRILSQQQCRTMFPNNQVVAALNMELEGISAATPTTRAGTLSEGEIERASRSMKKSSLMGAASVMASTVANYAGETSRVSGDQKSLGDEFERSSGYTSPRTLTLNTKYQGAVKINIWTGFAVQVISSKSRKVELGPQPYLLDYDEDLEVLSFSTGKPKTTDNLLSTVYLQVQNNKVSDVIEVETVEGVKAQVYVSYLVNFEGSPDKWFSVSNYVKLLCDRVRSMLKGVVRKQGIESFYVNSTDVVRDTVLGKSVEGKRDGLTFEENGMRVKDVDVLNVTILNPQLAQRLQSAQLQVIDTNLNLAAKRRELEFVRETEALTQTQAKVEAETQKLKDAIDIDLTKSMTARMLAEADGELAKYEKQLVLAKAINEKEDFVSEAMLDRKRAEEELRLSLAAQNQAQLLEKLKAETDAVVAKLGALKDGYGEILGALSERDVLVKMTEAQNLLNLVHKDAKSEALITSIIEMRSLKEVLNGATRGIVVNPLQASQPTQPKV